VGRKISGRVKCGRNSRGVKNQQVSTGRKRKLALAILLAGSIAVAIAAIRRPASGSAGGPPVVAAVNGVKIPSRLYQMYLKNGIDGLSIDPATADGRRQVNLLKEGIIAELIDRQLIESEAHRRGLVASSARLDKEYSNTVARMGGDTKFKAYLTEHGISDEEFRRTISQEVSGQLVREDLGKEVDIAEDDVRDFYDRESNNSALAELFIEPERVRANHILIAARPGQIAAEIQADGNIGNPGLQARVQAEMTRRRERAGRLLAMIKGGGSFESLAREFSEDPATKSRGGDLGLFTRNTHTAQFDQAAFSIEPGQVSGIVTTEFGYHIIKVTEHIREHRRTLDEARQGLRSLLLDRKQASHLKEWLATRRRESDIHIDPFYRVGRLVAFGTGSMDN